LNLRSFVIGKAILSPGNCPTLKGFIDVLVEDTV
jgi:hypothetical protein